jgi:hypothetical protein
VGKNERSTREVACWIFARPAYFRVSHKKSLRNERKVRTKNYKTWKKKKKTKKKKKYFFFKERDSERERERESRFTPSPRFKILRVSLSRVRKCVKFIRV